jgi:quinol monooxygenase YgiN
MDLNISRYASIAEKIGEAAAKTQQGLVPLLKGQPGCLGYAALASEQGDGISLHVWENADALARSRDKIRTSVQANSAAFLNPDERFHGAVTQHALAAPQSGGQGQSLYCMIRQPDNVPAGAGEARLRQDPTDAVRKVAGFCGIYFLRNQEDMSRAVSVLFCDNHEHAMAAHQAALAATDRNDRQITVRVAASGQTAVLGMA